MKNSILFFLMSSVLVLFPLLARADFVSTNMMNNYFEIRLTNEENATIYLTSDSTFTLIPSADNQDHKHICWGEWKLNEKSQEIRFKKAEECRFLEGIYHVKKIKHAIEIKNKDKVFYFRQIQ